VIHVAPARGRPGVRTTTALLAGTLLVVALAGCGGRGLRSAGSSTSPAAAPAPTSTVMAADPARPATTGVAALGKGSAGTRAAEGVDPAAVAAIESAATAADRLAAAGESAIAQDG